MKTYCDIDIDIDIDIAKCYFVAGLNCLKKTKIFPHNPKGIQQAIEYLKAFNVDLKAQVVSQSHSLRLYTTQTFKLCSLPHVKLINLPCRNLSRKPMQKCWLFTPKY